MVIVEDNTFDFKVRDRLKKECEERNFHMGEDTLSMMFLDMITYCSRGNEEAAVLNLIATTVTPVACSAWLATAALVPRPPQSTTAQRSARAHRSSWSRSARRTGVEGLDGREV